MRLPRILAPFALLLGACAPSPKVPSTSSNAVPVRPSLVTELSTRPDFLVREVALARGMQVGPRVPLDVDAEGPFADAWKTKVAAESWPAMPSVTPAFTLAFGLPSRVSLGQGNARPKPSGEAAGMNDVLEEQLLGFYDQTTRHVHVRDSRMHDDKDKNAEVMRRYIVAHEIQHALQHQRFGPLQMASLSEDALLARLALLEGDATAAGVATLAASNNRPVKRALARVNDVVRDSALNQIAASDGRNRALREAPADQRARLLFPYSSGFTFVVDLHRAGGFHLVDTAFDKPPVSTEQVLHPEKYLAGNLPAELPAPTAPEGWTKAVAGTVGELLTSVVLATCVDKTIAIESASGWGGDSYAVFSTPSRAVALSWTTSWDDEASAIRFERTISGMNACWSRSSKLGDYQMGAGWTVRREGARVVLARGFGASGDAVASSLLAVPIITHAAQPLPGKLRIAPIRAKSSAPGGALTGSRYTNSKLNVLSDAPPGFSSKLDASSMALTVTREGGGAIGIIELSEELPNETMRTTLFANLERSFAKGSNGTSHLRATGEGDVPTTFGPGFARDYVIPGKAGGIRAIVVPICHGSGALVLSTLWLDRAGANVLKEWLANTLPLTQEEPPICADLDP